MKQYKNTMSYLEHLSKLASDFDPVLVKSEPIHNRRHKSLFGSQVWNNVALCEGSTRHSPHPREVSINEHGMTASTDSVFSSHIGRTSGGMRECPVWT